MSNSVRSGGRLSAVADRGLWLANRARRYSRYFGWRRGASLAWRDRPSADGSTTLAWPGYRTDFHVRLGASDLRTFVHVVADAGYELPFPVEPTVVVDAGANTGMASAYFAEQWPDALVIAVEPDEENFALLERHTAAYPNVRRVRAALWTAPGTVPLSDPGEGPWAYRVDVDGTVPATGTAVEVPAVDLPTLLADHGVDHVDVLKCDIEGSELEVFADSARWIDKVDVVVAELHDRMKPGCSRAFFRATEGFTLEHFRDEDVFVRRPGR